jgi:hypothetical protein
LADGACGSLFNVRLTNDRRRASGTQKLELFSRGIKQCVLCLLKKVLSRQVD